MLTQEIPEANVEVLNLGVLSRICPTSHPACTRIAGGGNHISSTGHASAATKASNEITFQPYHFDWCESSLQKLYWMS